MCLLYSLLYAYKSAKNPSTKNAIATGTKTHSSAPKSTMMSAKTKKMPSTLHGISTNGFFS